MADDRSSARRDRPRLLARIATWLLPVVSLLLVWGIFEVGLRLTGHQAIYEIYSKPSLFWEHDERLGWRHQPGAEGEYVGPRPWPIEFQSRVSINSIGLRGGEIPPRPPAERRVLFVGDSMVAAFEVEYEESFVSLLDVALDERIGAPVRVINGGVRGYGTDQALLFYRHVGRDLDPDLVVFFHSGNDRIDNTTIHEMRRPFGKPALVPTDDAGLEVVGTPVPLYPMCSEFELSAAGEIERVDTLASRASCRAQMMLFDHSALFSYLTLSVSWDVGLLRRLYYLGNPHAERLMSAPPVDPSSEFSTRLTQSIIREFQTEVERDGSEFMLVSLPRHVTQLDRPALEAWGIPTRTLDEIEAVPRTEVSWKHDSHFNPEGHRRVTAILLPWIEEHLRARLAVQR